LHSRCFHLYTPSFLGTHTRHFFPDASSLPLFLAAACLTTCTLPTRQCNFYLLPQQALLQYATKRHDSTRHHGSLLRSSHCCRRPPHTERLGPAGSPCALPVAKRHCPAPYAYCHWRRGASHRWYSLPGHPTAWCPQRAVSANSQPQLPKAGEWKLILETTSRTLF
ncbi:uncharacterized protein B0I36DRAFT_384177, partial [Microdochium trichocladiopsis]